MAALDLHGPGHKPKVKLPGTQSSASSVKTGAPASTKNQRSDSHNEDVNGWKEQGAGWVQGDSERQGKRWTTSEVEKLVRDAFQANGRYLPGGYTSSGDGGYDPIGNITAKPAASVQSGVKTEAVPIAPAQMVTPQATSSTASSAPRPGVPKNQPLNWADSSRKAAGLPDPTPSSNARPRATKGIQKSSASNSGSKRAGRGETNASARDDAPPTRGEASSRLFFM